MQQASEIHIYLSPSKSYLLQGVTAITSILSNHKTNEKLCFHIIHSDFTENEFKIKEFFENSFNNFSLDFVKIDGKVFDEYIKDRDLGYLAINTFYRFLISDIVPKEVKKVIYLDCDLIVVDDISKLYYEDINSCIAGVIEDKLAKKQIKNLSLNSNNYFNAGVLLLNIDEIKKTDILKDVFNYYENKKDRIEYFDQDILNGIWDGKVKYLDEKYNAQSYSFLRMKKRYKKVGVKRINNPVILHYSGSSKPWQIYCRHKKADEWFKYQQLTPYKLSNMELFIFKMKRFLSKIFYIETHQNYNVYLCCIKIRIKKRVFSK